MSVTITTIQPQDSIASSRLTLNSNFSALKAGVDAVHLLLNPTTAILSGVKSVVINDNAVSSSTSILQVGKGSSLLGNVIMGTTGASTSVLVNGNGGFTIVQSSVTMGIGNLTLQSATSLANFGGHVSTAMENRQPGLATAFSGIISLTGATGINVAGLKYVVLKNDSILSGMTASLSAGSAGQVLEIFHTLGASAYPILIDTTNFYGLTGPIAMTYSNDTLKAVYDGVSWYLLGYNAASFATSVGATLSSITFTTV